MTVTFHSFPSLNFVMACLTKIVTSLSISLSKAQGESSFCPCKNFELNTVKGTGFEFRFNL